MARVQVGAACNGASVQVSTTRCPVDCSTLDVPLDYTDSASDKKLTLQLLRVPAPVQPSKGSVLVNFGGPGFEARNTLVTYADALTDCFSSPAASALMTATYPLKAPGQADNGMGTLWAEAGAWGQACGKNETAAEMGGLVGTAFVARDLMQVVDALGEDGKLRYWGISYGTTLGATVAAMFPDRMDKVILDAVVNSHRYYHNSGVDIDQLDSADEAWRLFLSQCIEAGPEKCAIAALGSNAIELETALEIVRASYRTNPVAVNGTVVDYTLVSNLYYFFARMTPALAAATSLLLSIVTRENLEAVVNAYAATMEVFGVYEPHYSIKCGDQFPRYDNLSAAEPDIEYYMQSSPLFGDVAVSISAVCARWPFAAKERYEGDFRVKTASPVLLLQNTWDAATSLDSAFNMSAGFEGSVVVEQEGFGHGTFAQPSKCSMEWTRAYFVNGTLPDGNVKCPVDVSLFS
ncbi:TAP-like protein-domain-containing protein [Microdochium trichocladiopsis]|uniref:TAP-like protein-domain-containing protein n=1 Tax=Microdochium trichocladiopsis TaxID=1682393 RepID=A0A9P9BPI9_9PEZI|nr:TAP-like protein-domain-containing protein [Microdochium trichocladiopsis]KAH7024596.1 TAP-like protein-domain-containing protein [Microdochium trichocladiopsis]